jgi:MFS transporter, DHA2 family, multidrug resistance protein
MTLETAAKAGRREWIGLGVIALPCVLYAMDLTVLNLAGPHITSDLHPTSAQFLWIMDIYGFVLAGSLMTMGALGDRVGRRRLLLAGAAAFGLASLVAAFSTSAGMLIAARALMGIAGATLAPSTLSLIRNMFLQERQRTLAIALWASSYSFGAAIGPLLGGLLLEHFWWGSVFLLAVPVMVLLLVLGPILLPEFREPVPARMDVLSACLSLAAVLLVIYGLKQLAQGGLGWPVALALLSGVTIGGLFIRRQRTLADPFLDLELFRAPAFSLSLVVTTLGIFVAFGSDFFVAQHLQLVLGLSPLQAGLWTAPAAAGLIVGPLLVPLLARRVRPGVLMSAGLAVMAIGCGLLSQVNASSGLWVVVIASVIIFLGLPPIVVLATDQVVGAAQPERAGSASAISETSFEFGGALGIAVLGSMGAATYRAAISAALPPSLPASLSEAARATLASAVAVSRQLPGDIGGSVLGAARDAFIQGLHLIAVVGVIVALGAAVVNAALARRSAGSREVEGGGPQESGQLAVLAEVEQSWAA